MQENNNEEQENYNEEQENNLVDDQNIDENINNEECDGEPQPQPEKN